VNLQNQHTAKKAFCLHINIIMAMAAAVVVGGGIVIAAGLGIAQIGILTQDTTNLVEHLSANEKPLEKHDLDGKYFLISEGYVLIWHDERDGLFHDQGLPLLQTVRNAVLLAAYFLDLIALNKIELQYSKEKKERAKVIVKDGTEINNYLDYLLKKLVDHKKPRSLRKWILLEHTDSRYLRQAQKYLAEKSIFEKKVEKKLMMNKSVYILKDVARRDDLKKILRAAALDNAVVSGNTLALLGLLLETETLHSSLLPRIFEKDELPTAINRIKLRVGHK